MLIFEKREIKYRNTPTIFFALTAFFLICFFAPACPAQETSSQIKSSPQGTHTLTLTVNGLERTYIVYVPRTYNPAKKTALVIMLHGGGGKAKGAMWETGWAAKAEQEGFLAVFPNAMPPNPKQRSSFVFNPQLWNDGSDRFFPGSSAPDDVAFINAMIDDLIARFAVDEKKIFLTGFSNGASLSFLAGIELANRIAAIAPVAGACWPVSLKLSSPVSLLYITGTEDPLNVIEGGVPRLASGQSDKVRGKPKPPVRDSIMKWAKALACPAAPANTVKNNGVSVETFRPCSHGSEVVYITVEGLGHTWAGGRSLLPETMVGKTTDKINANDVIWDFFQKHVKAP